MAVTLVCATCGGEFSRDDCQADRAKYCSQTCYWAAKRGRPIDHLSDRRREVPIAALIESYNTGETTRDIAARLGVSRYTVARRLHAAGVAVRPAHARATYSHDRTFFDMIDTESKAYWLGFIAADGCITRRGKKGSALTVALAAKDRQHIERLRDALGATNPIEEQPRTQSARLSIGGDALPDALARHDILPRKSLTQGWPTLTGELLRHWLRGYFDGDGSISLCRARGRKPSLQLNVIGAVALIDQWRDHFEPIGGGRGSLVVPRGNRAVAVAQYGGNRQVRLIHEYLYGDSTIALPRKTTLPAM